MIIERALWRGPCPPLLRLICLAAAGVLCLVALPGVAAAQEFVDEEGCGCHSEQVDSWQHSAHGRALIGDGGTAGPTCEACHGSYVRGHPDEGVMSLVADSGACQECHAETYGQWQGTMHAAEGVQCIGCHLTHSQTLRLASDQLCASCHRESPTDAFHGSHLTTDVDCTDCHVSHDAHLAVGSEEVAFAPLAGAPSHDFTSVSAASCLDCHREQVAGSTDGVPDTTMIELMTVANRVPVLSAKLEAVEKENHELATVTYVALGLGIGIGAVMGMVLVLAASYVSQRDEP